MLSSPPHLEKSVYQKREVVLNVSTMLHKGPTMEANLRYSDVEASHSLARTTSGEQHIPCLVCLASNEEARISPYGSEILQHP